MSGAAMRLTAATSGFVIFLLFTSVIQAQSDWGVIYHPTKICALKGSTVNLLCSFTPPSKTDDGDTTLERAFWFTQRLYREPVDLRTEPDYAGRVQYSHHNGVCNLTIADLRESDSAVYKFRLTTDRPDWRHTGEPGVTLSVTGFQVQKRQFSSCVIASCKWAHLKCHSSCLPTYQTSFSWYKNGVKMQTEKESFYDNFYPADSYSCAARGFEAFVSPSSCVTGQYCNRVTYAERRVCAFKGSSVNLSCKYQGYEYIASKFWFNPERSLVLRYRTQHKDLSKDPRYEGRVKVVETKGGRSTLTITDLRESDSDEYLFKFNTPSFEWRSGLPGTTLTVTDQDLQVQVIWSSAGPKLICHSSCLTGRLSFVWYQNETKKIPFETSSSYGGHVDPDDSYSCAYQSFHSPPVYGPRLPSVSVSPSEIVEGSSVTLTCSSDANPAASYTWYKKNQPRPHGEEPQLVFSSIQSSDSGQYLCEAENHLGKKRSEFISIDVKYGPKLPSVSVSPSEIVEGSSVTLTCSSDANPAANYTWYKKNQPRPHGEEPQLVFSSIQSSDSGQYLCEAENHLGKKRSEFISIDVKYGPRLPSVSVSPSEIVEGSSVTLSCSSDANPAANYTWYKKNQTSPHGEGDIYCFTSISSEDRGIYYCKAENQHEEITSSSLVIDVQLTTTISEMGPVWNESGINAKSKRMWLCISLRRKDGPRLPSVSASPSAEIVEGSSVTLSCCSDANPAANYTWYKEDEDSPTASGQIFIINDFRAEHSGSYSCEAQNNRGRSNSTFHLTVLAGAWKSVAAVTIPVVLLALVLLAVFLWIRRKKSDGGERAGNRAQLNVDLVYDVASAPAPGRPAEHLHYSSVRFAPKPEEALYSNIRPAHGQTEDEVEYTAVQTAGAGSAAPRTSRERQEDSFALYSTVNK